MAKGGKKVVYKRSTRTVDKNIIQFHHEATGGAALDTSTVCVDTATYPGTITGIRVKGVVATKDSGVAAKWGLVLAVEKQGQTLSAANIGITDAATVFQPEQAVLYHQTGMCLSGNTFEYDDNIKTQRKIAVGDKVKLLFHCDNPSGSLKVHNVGSVQYFMKS